MQNDKNKCGLIERKKGEFSDPINLDVYVWNQNNWTHDDYEHVHARGQLSFVSQGYQYFYIENSIYLVPQNHVIWIPSKVKHKSRSEAEHVDLMVILYANVPEIDFFRSAHVFAVPTLLREMLGYASKWSQNFEETKNNIIFCR